MTSGATAGRRGTVAETGGLSCHAALADGELGRCRMTETVR